MQCRETKALVDTRAENLPEARARTNVETLGDLKTDEQMATMVDALAEVKAKKLGATLGDVDAKACLTLADTVAETELNTRSNILENVNTDGIIDRMADTLPEHMNKTFSRTLFDMEAEQLIDDLQNSTKDGNPITSQDTSQCRDQVIGQHASLKSTRSEG